MYMYIKYVNIIYITNIYHQILGRVYIQTHIYNIIKPSVVFMFKNVNP